MAVHVAEGAPLRVGVAGPLRLCAAGDGLGAAESPEVPDLDEAANVGGDNLKCTQTDRESPGGGGGIN